MTEDVLTIIVVSDKFANFAENAGVSTLSQFQQMLRNGNPQPQTVVLGQGLGVDSVASLKSHIACEGLKDVISIAPRSEVMAPQAVVHKNRGENVTISDPIKVGEKHYVADLLLDERCDEMRDHVTGQHIQGTLLIEAARQMMMACVEYHAFSEETRGSYSYILKQINIQYLHYVFPVSVSVHCLIQHLDVSDKGVLSTSLCVDFVQAGETVCSIKCEAEGLRAERLKIVEKKCARRALRYEQSEWRKGLEPTAAEIA